MNWWQRQFSLQKANRILRLSLFIFVFVLFVGLAANYFVIFGEKKISYDFSKKSPYISLFTPLDRVEQVRCEECGCYQVFRKEPIYFRLLTTTNFDHGELTLQYKTYNQPVVELGVAVGRDNHLNQLYPVKNDILQSLINSPDWQVVQKDDLYLIQKQKDFDTIPDFLNNLPYDKKIALYNYELNYDYQIADYQPQEEKNELLTFIKGSHNLFTYINNEALDFEFEFADLNQKTGPDEIKIAIFATGESEPIKEIKIIDDQISDDSGYLTDNIVQQVLIENLASQVYRLEIITTEDIVIKKIITSQQKLAFDHRLNFLAQDTLTNNWPKLKLPELKLFTVAQNIYFQAFEVNSLQTVLLNNQELEIKERITIQKQQSDAYLPIEITIPKQGLLVQSDGLLSFDAKQYFNHQPYNFRAVSRLSQVDFDYILAKYTLPKQLADGWQEKTVEFDLAKAYYDLRQVRFMISMPQIEENRGRLDLRQMDFILKK